MNFYSATGRNESTARYGSRWAEVFLIFILLCSVARAAPSRAARDDFWVPDGPVFSVVENKGVIYIGGLFDYIGPVSETGLAFDGVSGFTLTDFPHFTGSIKAIINDNAGGWFVGGQFTSVGGWPVTNLVHIRGADRTVDTAWMPNPDDAVLALATDGTRLFVGGTFTHIGGHTRLNLAAVDPATGAVISNWQADCTTRLGKPSVNALAVSKDRLYVGGYFAFIHDGSSTNREPREHIASLNAATGRVTDWYPNGYTGGAAGSRVDALALAGNILYVGGTFTTIGGDLTNGLPRRHLAAFDVIKPTYNLLPWDPDADGSVTSIAVSCDTVYVGGAFHHVGGAARTNIAALDASTGRATSWDANANNDVLSLMLVGNVLYAGGKFTEIGGRPRSFLAALDTALGHATAWNPKADFGVAGIASSGGAVVSGGALGPGGKLRRNVAALNARTGKPLDWSPQVAGGITNSGALAEGVYAMAVSANAIFLGGPFTEIDGQSRSNLAAVDPRTGALMAWNPNANGIVEALAASGSTIYVGGRFSEVGGAPRTNIAALQATTGMATSWNPNANDKVKSITRKGRTVYVGGLFTQIGGSPRKRLAALNASTGLATAWDPNVSDQVSALSISGSQVFFGGAFSAAGEQSRSGLAAAGLGRQGVTCWNPEAQLITEASARAAGVNAVQASGRTVFFGGSFNTVRGEVRNSLAAIQTACPATLTQWNPDVDGAVNTLAVVRGNVYAGGVFQRVGGAYRPNFVVFPPEGAPVITNQSANRIVPAGQTLVLEPVAAGRGRLSYQWQLNGTNIPGATRAALTIPNAQVHDSGEYVLVVTNALGLVHSRPATVTITEPLDMVAQPQSQTVPPGTALELSVEVVGNPRPIYQWRLNGVNIPGAISSTYTVTNARPQDGGSYEVVAANNLDAVVSDPPATVIVTSPSLVLSDERSNAVALATASGQGTGSNAGASSEMNERHAGKVGGSSVWVSWIAPETGVATFSTRGSTFDTLVGVYALDTNGIFSEVASDDDAGGFHTSQAVFNAVAGTNYFIAIDGLAGATGQVVLTWTNEPGVPEIPRFTTQPFDQSVFTNDTVRFPTATLGGEPVTYQWFKNCDAIPGATNATLTLSNVTFDDVGNYRVVAVNASSNVVESVTASLEIGPVPSAFSHDKLEDLLAIADAEDAAGFGALAKALTPTAFVPVVAGTIVSQRFNNIRATTHAREPLICGKLGGASKWFGLRARTNGLMVIDTIGSRIDTLLSAYRRTNLLALAEPNNQLGCNDNGAPDGSASIVSFPVNNGQQILVSVDGANGQQGRVVLNWKITNEVAGLNSLNGISPKAGAAPSSRLVEMKSISVERPSRAGEFRVSVAGTDQDRLVLETSTNLIQWTPIYTNPPQSPAAVFDLPMNGTAQRFFRVVR